MAKKNFDDALVNFKLLNHLRGQCLTAENIIKVSHDEKGFDFDQTKEELDKVS